MKYYLDTEFVEGFRQPMFGKRRHFIDLISIGIVSEELKQYYAICNSFDLHYVWNNKDTWVKENVLRPLHAEMCGMIGGGEKYMRGGNPYAAFTEYNVKILLQRYGKSELEIKIDLLNYFECTDDLVDVIMGHTKPVAPTGIEIYAYFGSYDWVVFCSIFGRMMDLPENMPMYPRDLKQMMDERGLTQDWKKIFCPDDEVDGNHNALIGADWNRKFHKAILKAQENPY
jgi:hypothetical protein